MVEFFMDEWANNGAICLCFLFSVICGAGLCFLCHLDGIWMALTMAGWVELRMLLYSLAASWTSKHQMSLSACAINSDTCSVLCIQMRAT